MFRKTGQRKGSGLSRTELRLGVSLVVCLTLTVVAMMAYNGWLAKNLWGHAASVFTAGRVYLSDGDHAALQPMLTVNAASPDGPKGDLKVYPEPALRALPRAGGKLTDPVFGTEIMRVTDERGGVTNGTFYAYWPTFNSNSTRLLVRRGNDTAVYDFNPDTFTLGAQYLIPSISGGNGSIITEGATWSSTDPDVLYAVGWTGPKIWAFNARTRSYTLVRDFTPEFGATDFFWQMSMSEDGDVFAFTHKNSAGQAVGYTVWKRSTNKVLNVTDAGDFNEVQLDKTGRYLDIPLNGTDASGFSYYVRDLQTGVVTGLTDAAPDHAPGHGDVGRGTNLAWDNDDNRLLLRSLATPHQFKTVLNLGSDWTMNLHLSYLGESEEWALVSFYSYKKQPTVGLFHNELVLVATDGSQAVRRICHHRSIANDYWQIPKATLSRDGRFAAFTSNWGGSPRTDLFIARINPVLPTSSTQPQSKPASTQPLQTESGKQVKPDLPQRPRRVNPR